MCHTILILMVHVECVDLVARFILYNNLLLKYNKLVVRCSPCFFFFFLWYEDMRALCRPKVAKFLHTLFYFCLCFNSDHTLLLATKNI